MYHLGKVLVSVCAKYAVVSSNGKFPSSGSLSVRPASKPISAKGDKKTPLAKPIGQPCKKGMRE
jgi:hypothetical protein